jgi:hypothetical protein
MSHIRKAWWHRLTLVAIVASFTATAAGLHQWPAAAETINLTDDAAAAALTAAPALLAITYRLVLWIRFGRDLSRRLGP